MLIIFVKRVDRCHVKCSYHNEVKCFKNRNEFIYIIRNLKLNNPVTLKGTQLKSNNSPAKDDSEK